MSIDARRAGVPAQAREPAQAARPDPGVRVALFETMVLCRTYEEAILAAYHADKGPGFDIGKGLIPGEMHLSAGQEPVAAGVCAHLTADDAVTATHRPHHLAVAHGVDLRRMTAEIFGRETGLGRGRGGHMHLFDPATHFSCSGIIAEGYPPALGQAFAFLRSGSDRVAVAVTGEGAANQGAFHESLNLAALWALPVVFVVEDNDWGISVRRRRRPPSPPTPTAPRRTASRASGSRTTTSRRCTPQPGAPWRTPVSGRGPSLVEVQTLRMWGHFEGDAQGYRADLDGRSDERDPVTRYEQVLLDADLLDADGVAGIRERARAQVADAVDFARQSPVPGPVHRHRLRVRLRRRRHEHHRDPARDLAPADHLQGHGGGADRGDGARRLGVLPR